MEIRWQGAWIVRLEIKKKKSMFAFQREAGLNRRIKSHLFGKASDESARSQSCGVDQGLGLSAETKHLLKRWTFKLLKLFLLLLL